MDFTYSEEQELLRDTLKRYLAQQYDFETRKKLSASELGYGREHWKNFAEMGLLGLTIPEQHGGMAGAPVDTMLVMEAFGRALVLEPYLATVVTCGALLCEFASAEQQSAILPAVAAGQLTLALAHDEPGARYDVSYVTTRAQNSGAGYVIDGRKTVVWHGASADKLLVSARTSGNEREREGVSLFLVDRKQAGVRVDNHATQDGQRAAELTLTQVQVPQSALVGKLGQGLNAVERAREYAIAASCAESVGVMDALNEVTLEYLKTRRQFGVPIGKFQVLQHRMADMVIATEQARSMAIVAALKLRSQDAAERSFMLSAAKALVAQSARFVGQQAVQLHGGMGVTNELIAAHYFKRLTVLNLTLGDADHHLSKVSDQLLEGHAFDVGGAS
jgi:alkylation response protein AidB-like acyl-CoA dehydrogenase